MCGVRVFCGHWVSGRKGRICNVGIGLKMVRAAIHMWRMVMHKRSSRYTYSVEGSFDHCWLSLVLFGLHRGQVLCKCSLGTGPERDA